MVFVSLNKYKNFMDAVFMNEYRLNITSKIYHNNCIRVGHIYVA